MPRDLPRPRVALCVVLLASVFASAAEAKLPDSSTLRLWIEEMKQSPRGPFERIRWFCADGSIQPPEAYACRDHGGGVQHGEWNARTVELRDGGYLIANVYAGISPTPFLGPDARLSWLDQMLLERFLIKVDDGWIIRGARTYRGALQAEDEESGARALVLAMLADPAWLAPARFTRLRESVRLLPLPRGDQASAAKVRHLALELAEKDTAFTPLRAKIHNAPEAGDADAVRGYARRQAPASLRQQYESLATQIEALYATGGTVETLQQTAAALEGTALAPQLHRSAEEFAAARGDAKRFAVVGAVLAQMREALADPALSPEQRLVLLEASLELEDDAYTIATTLLPELEQASRRQRLDRLGGAVDALYGVGFVTNRHREGVHASLERIERNPSLDVDTYRTELRYLARVPEWSSAWLDFNFGETMRRWMAIEPKSHLFTQDRLRGSPLLFYSRVIDGLSLDANRLAGIEHDLFGRKVGAGLRALNPGMARGTLVAPAEAPEGGFSRDGIYLLPESTSDLPRVSGILTRGEGSSLSHVQLLARNLGIPNVVVGEEHVPAVQRRDGEQVVLAVSPQGVVQLTESSPRWDEIFGREHMEEGVVIRPDLEKLDLTPSMVPLSRLRASDSGRLSGPKGANLGELKHFFGDRVPDGFVITFGVFRKLLDKPIEPGGPSTFEWMKREYRRIARLSGPARDQAVSTFLARLRGWIERQDPGAGFRQGLKVALDRLGPEGTFGVFVRSDTNVEDLPGFTGAGLNLTVPNVVGYEQVLAAVKEVWASPFTERAFGWRQSHMEQPEYVFPAVVVQRSFPSEKSGVLVTVDVDTGRPGWLSVAVSEGVGGAVEGQAAESLLINQTTGEVRYLAQATAARKAVLSPRGGVDKVPASGTSQVLEPGEIQQLIAFSKLVAERFPSLRDEDGTPLPADVEFAFRDGRLTLLQIRAFNESRNAQRSAYLSQLDAEFRERGARRVELDGVPRAEDT